MVPVELLIIPLRILLTALGTGRIPGNDPVTAITALAPDLMSIRDNALRSADTVAASWRGAGGAAARSAATTTARRTTDIEADGDGIVTLTQTAAGRVASAAEQLSALLDSFERAARALASDVFTPAGFAALLPIALDHIGRGVAVVERTRGELGADTAALTALGRHETPAQVTTAAASAVTADGRSGDLSITLPDGSVVQAPNQRAATAVRAALSQRGVPYLWGGTTPAGFDCSGLTQWAYRQAGVELPRLAQDQDNAGFRIAQADVRPGDIAVWDGHVSLIVGNGQMIEAGDPVQVSAIRTTNAGQGFQGFYRLR